MATRKQKVRVGLFLLTSFALIAAVITLVAGLFDDHGIHHWIIFNESVLGLYDGGTVEYMGVPIGKVRDISVTRENKVRVEIVVDPNKATLYSGVEARLVTSSIAAGTLAVSLSGGDPKVGELPVNSTIPSKVSALTAISAQLEEMMGQVNDIAAVMNNGLKGMEEGGITGIVQESKGLVEDARVLVNEATSTVKSVREEADTAISRVLEVADGVKAFAESATELSNSLKTKIEPLDVPALQENLQRVLENASALAKQLDATVAGVGNTMDNVTHEASNVEYALRSSLRELTDTLESMRLLGEQLRNDPSSLIWGRETSDRGQ